MPENLDWKPVNPAPQGLQWEPVKAPEESSIASETLKAPARVVGGIAQELGEAAQYVTSDRVGKGIRQWGEGVQQRNAQTESFRAEHPAISMAGDVAEGAAKMAPYLAADLLVPEAAIPATAGRIAKGIRAIKAAPFSTAVLPTVMGASQGERSYEKGVQNGLTPEEALKASLAPAAVTGAGMAGMGVASHGLQALGGEAKTLVGGFAKHAVADTGIMMAQGVATSAAEKATGIDPEAKPLDQLKDPKAWAQAALTGGMFAGLGVAKKGLVAKALKEHLKALEEAPPEERTQAVEALASAVHSEDPAAQAAFQAKVMDDLQAGEPVLSENLVNRLTAEPKVEETRESVLQGLKDSIESGGEVNPIEAHNAAEEGKVVDALRAEAPQEPTSASVKMFITRDDRQQLYDKGFTREQVDAMKPEEAQVHLEPSAPAIDPVALRAENWAREGRTISKLDGTPDAEVAAHLDSLGYQLVDNGSVKTGSRHVREWLVEKKPEPEVETLAPQEEMKAPMEPAGPAPISDREQRLAYEDNPNLIVARKDGKIALIDQKEKAVIGMAEIKDGKLGDWLDGKEPATPAERVQTEAVFRRHLGEEARLNRTPSKDEIAEAKAEVVKRLADSKGLESEARRQGITVDDLTSRLELQLDQYSRILKGEVKYADLQAKPEAAAIKAHLDPIVKGLKVPVEVVSHAGEIEGLRPEAPAFNGAFHQGRIYLNAEHLSSLKEAEHVLLKHELAHAGLLGTLGREGLEKVLAKAWGDVNSGVREFAKEKGIETRTKAGKLEATEEFMVSLAEQGSKHPLWDKFVAVLKAALRKAGFSLKFSERELRSLVMEATRSMKTGEGPTRFSRLYRGDSINEDGLGEGSIGDLGKGHYFTDSPQSAEYFTDGSDPAHTKAFEVGIEKPFDLMGRSHADDPRWKEMLATLPKDPEYGDKPKANLEKWAAGKLDVRNPYGFVARSFGQTPETFNDFLAAHGYDGVTDQGIRGIAEGGRQYVAFDKAAVQAAETAARFSRVASHAAPKDVDKFSAETSAQLIRRALSDTAGNVFRTFMPIDKTLKMAATLPAYQPIKHQFERLVELRRFKEAAGTAPSIDAKHVTDEVARVVKTDAELKTYNDLTHKATLYELHADPKKPIPWTEKSWKESGKLKQTGLSLGQAVAEVRSLWEKMTPAQREVQQRAIAHMKELRAEHVEAQVDGLRAIFPEEVFGPAEKVAETLHKELWKAEQMGGPEGRGARRAEMSTEYGADVMDVAEQIASIRSEGELKGDYAPLMRFGDFKVETFQKTAGGEGKRLKVEHFESKKDMIAAVKAIQANPSLMAKYEHLPEGQRSVVNIPLEFLNKMQRAMDEKGIPEDQQKELMQDFQAARVATMPRNSLAGNKLNREGVAGFNEDAVRSYAAYVQRSSKAISNLKYGTKIDQVFRDMDNDIKAYQDPEADWNPAHVERMSSLKDMLYTLEKQHNTEKINEITKAIGKSTFLWYLSSPSVWAVQWSQPFITTIPKMAARYGFGKAFGAYVSEAKNHMAGKFSDQKIDEFDRSHDFIGKKVFQMIEQYREALPAEKKQLAAQMKSIYDGFSETEQKLLILKVMSHQGMIDLSAAHSLHDLVNSTDPLNKGIDWAVEKGGTFMRASETGSRRAAAVSAFQMALKDHKDFMKANDYASNIIDDTLFDFSSQNRAAIMKGNVGRVIGQFQFFRLHMLGKTIQLAKDAFAEAKDESAARTRSEARKELAYMTGVSMALAGAGGTPLAMLASNTVTDAVWGAMSFLFGDPDDPWDPKQDFENALQDAVGEGASNTFMKGLPYLMGMDISKRIGLGGMADLIQGEVPPGASATDKANWYAAKILGPSWGLVTDGIKTADAIGNGDYGTASKAGSPKVLRDFMKAYDLTDGGVKGSGGRTVLQAEDVSPFSIALQMVGINPSDVSLAQEEARELANLSTTLKQRRNLLTKRVTEATLEGDMDAREEALEAINEWGQKQPALKITMKELANAVKRGMDLKAGKLTKQQEALRAEKEGAP